MDALISLFSLTLSSFIAPYLVQTGSLYANIQCPIYFGRSTHISPGLFLEPSSIQGILNRLYFGEGWGKGDETGSG